MASINTLGIDTLSIRGASGEYHRLNRFFRSRAEAEAALASGDFVPQAGVVNALLVGGEGILIYNETTESFDALDSATKEYIDSKVADLINDFDASDLDSIQELADAINNNPNFWADTQSNFSNLASDISSEIVSRQNGDQVNHEEIVTTSENLEKSVTAMGIDVGDTSFTFEEDMLLVDVDEAASYSEVHTLITTEGPDTPTETDLKTALERFAKNARIALKAEKLKIEVEDARLTALLGVDHLATTLGTFNGTTISDDTDVKTALQELEAVIESVDLDTDDLAALNGIAENVTDLGTFDKDIISDNVAVKVALQELETAVASLQGQSKVHNYKWSNNNDATITSQHVTTDAADWANATKVYIHRLARHSIDMQNGLNNMLNVGAKLYIQRTDIADKFFTAIINSAPTITGSGTDQVFAYDVTDVETIGQVFNENMRVSVGVFSNVNEKMLNDVQADVDQNEADADAAIAALQADVDQNEADSDAADAALGVRIDNIEDGFAFQGDISTTGNLDVAGNLQIDNDGGYYIHFDRNTATQLDLATGNIPSGGNLNIKNSNGTDARVVVYSDEFWVRNLGGANGNGTAKFDGQVTVNDHLIIDDSNNAATEYNLNVKSSGSSVFGVLGNGAVLLGNNSGAPFMASADHHATSKKYVDDAISALPTMIHASWNASTGAAFDFANDGIASSGVSSVTRTAEGKYRVTFTNAFASNAYTVTCGQGSTDYSGSGASPREVSILSRDAAYVDVICERSDDAVNEDNFYMSVIIMG